MRYKWLILSLSILFSSYASSQTVRNVVARQVGGTVEITYDLDQDAQVSLLLSRDGGVTYTSDPKTIIGDVGSTTAGHKKMVWNLFADGTDWEIENARFKVIVAEETSKKVFAIRGVSFAMIAVEGGTFTMGATSEQGKDGDIDEKETHQVTLSDYYIGQTEVTQELWSAVMGSNPAYYKNGNNYPVENVSWDECQTFIQQLNSLLSSELSNMRFTLPTEAQWEYAARGGNKSCYYKYSGSGTLASVAWYKNNSYSTTYNVATKIPNELGIYDMSGNVWEWCQDRYGSYMSSPQTDPTGATTGAKRVTRGGSWFSLAKFCRVSCRDGNAQTVRRSNLGLRLVCQ